MVSPEEFAGTGVRPEFAVGAVRGMRCWAVNRDRTKILTLTGASETTFDWKAGENLAHCSLCFWYKHNNWPLSKPSMADCSHGFYAYYDKSNEFANPWRITGIIEGYGECVIGTKGFRANKARIVAFYLPPWWHLGTTFPGAFLLAVLLLFLLMIVSVVAALMGYSASMHWVTPFFSLAAFLTWIPALTKTRWGTGTGTMVWNPKMVRFLKQHYPDVPVYGSYRKMLSRHPLYSGLEGDTVVASESGAQRGRRKDRKRDKHS